jgi:hypothetical protein
LKVIAEVEVLKPLLKLGFVPGEEIVYKPLATGLAVRPVAIAMALRVVVALIEMGAEYVFVVPAPELGVVPSTV